MGASDSDSNTEQCEHCQREAIFNHEGIPLCGKHFHEILKGIKNDR